MLRIDRHRDERGLLCFVEPPLVPFSIARAYWFTGLERGEFRGAHGHRRLEQLVCCVEGAVRVEVHDGRDWLRFVLDSPDSVLYLPPMVWRKVEGMSERSACLVLASRPYEADDYLHDFEAFLAAAREADVE